MLVNKTEHHRIDLEINACLMKPCLIKQIYFNFVFQYRSTTLNQRADVLSGRHNFDYVKYENQPIQFLFENDKLWLPAISAYLIVTYLRAQLQKRLFLCQIAWPYAQHCFPGR